MTTALKWKSKLLLAKVEVTYGTDSTPTAAMLVKNVVCRPMEGEDVSRELEQPYRGAQDVFTVGQRTVIEFDVELVGGGTTGVAPPISPLLRGCGMAEVVTPDDDPGDGTVEYTPITDAQESVSFYFWIGGNRQKILGARGTATLNITAQAIPSLHFTFTGLWAMPAVTALPGSIDYSAFQKPLIANNVNTPVLTIGGVSLVTKSFQLDFANDVQPRLLIGREEILIVDFNEAITASVEAVALATFNPFDIANTLTEVAVAVQQDTRVGYKVGLACATCTVQRLASYENDQDVLMWPLRITPKPTGSGNNQFTLTLT